MLALDSKGRLSIPARYRQELADHCQGRMVITVQHHGKSLLLYPENEFEEVAREIRKLSDFDPVEQSFKYLFIGHAMELEMDSSGRVLPPPLLRQQVGIDRKVALVGQTNKFEIWDEDAWLERQRSLYTTEKEAGVSERLKGLAL